MNPHVELLIVAEEHLGKGETGDPYRVITVIYRLDGTRIADWDQWAINKAAEATNQEQP
jgi:hypothetical protein